MEVLVLVIVMGYGDDDACGAVHALRFQHEFGVRGGGAVWGDDPLNRGVDTDHLCVREVC